MSGSGDAMISAVFDCTTFLQAVTSRKGPVGGCLVLVDEKHVKLFVSADILKEIGEVLDRPTIRKSFPRLADEVHALNPSNERSCLFLDVDDNPRPLARNRSRNGARQQAVFVKKNPE